MNNIWGIVVIIVFIGIIALREYDVKTRIKSLLEEKGFQEIKITTRPFTGSRGTITLDVEYRNASGELRENSCVIHTNIFSDEKVYWEESLEE